MDANELSLAAAYRLLKVAPGASWLAVKDAYHHAIATSPNAFHLALVHAAHHAIALAGFPNRAGTPTHFDLGADKQAHFIEAMARLRRSRRPRVLGESVSHDLGPSERMAGCELARRARGSYWLYGPIEQRRQVASWPRSRWERS